MVDFILEWIKNNLSAFDSGINAVVTVLTDNFMQAGNPWYDIARNIAVIVQSVSLVIVTICFLIEFLKTTIQMDILKWEYMLKVFFKFVFAKVCMDLSFTVLGAVYETAAEWTAGVGTTASSIGASTYSVLQPSIQDYGFMDIIGLVFSLGFMFIALSIVPLIAQVMAYARKFEIVVLLSVAPLPCAFLPLEEGGASRIPKRYIMSFASVCLQGLFMIISIALYGMICTDCIGRLGSETSVSGIVGQIFLASLTLVMALAKSGGWAKSVLDVM